MISSLSQLVLMLVCISYFSVFMFGQVEYEFANCEFSFFLFFVSACLDVFIIFRCFYHSIKQDGGGTRTHGPNAVVTMLHDYLTNHAYGK